MSSSMEATWHIVHHGRMPAFASLMTYPPPPMRCEHDTCVVSSHCHVLRIMSKWMVKTVSLQIINFLIGRTRANFSYSHLSMLYRLRTPCPNRLLLFAYFTIWREGPSQEGLRHILDALFNNGNDRHWEWLLLWHGVALLIHTMKLPWWDILNNTKRRLSWVRFGSHTKGRVP